jgi:hypothetical protein
MPGKSMKKLTCRVPLYALYDYRSMACGLQRGKIEPDAPFFHVFLNQPGSWVSVQSRYRKGFPAQKAQDSQDIATCAPGPQLRLLIRFRKDCIERY